jgi:hypothetical protein
MNNVTKLPKKYKMLLVQYKGGGWDGCFWEWNYFYFDSKGKFHNLASSGWKGIKNEQEARDMIETPVENKHSNRVERYEYDLATQDGINEFCTECSEEHIIGIRDLVNEIEGKEILYAVCTACETKCVDGPLYPTGYHGIGGIAVQHDDFVCEDCYASNSCGHCGEYIGVYGEEEWNIDFENLSEKLDASVEELMALRDKLEDSCSYCPDCFESEAEDKFNKRK